MKLVNKIMAKNLEKEIEKQKRITNNNQKELTKLKLERDLLKKKLKNQTKAYLLEMRKALSTAILAAFAFLMALSWREYINEVIIGSVLSFSPVQGKLISALVVTVISVLGILLVTRFLAIKN